MELLGYQPDVWLPFVFAGLMGVSILLYVILDGYDLGVGILTPFAGDDAEKDMMVASIGPFWDANETWLVLAVGLLLVAFPAAHGMILSTLYLPVFILLVGLILRGVSFEFRVKARAKYKDLWNKLFFTGSLMATLAQGFMLGLYIMGLEFAWHTVLFSILCAIALTIGYAFIGATWLILKSETALQKRAVTWAKTCIWGLVLGIATISLASPLVSPRIFEKWFTFPSLLYLSPLPILSLLLLWFLWRSLSRMPKEDDRGAWKPFVSALGLFALAFLGLAYSFFPYVVPERLTIFEAASASESLFIILIGACFVVPTILAYTALAYWVFRGKTRELRYD
ncbi:cytochrome bd ubiquinol oxidase subunit II [Jannaschia pagri]|uniref:Cytochrome bd ubiquinol oxidase subunit II n=1 Tax=Jannaschia pagri TaxID=2829797 RepID=A0ABQ4NKY2_9RHOB|nr:MULTISPECIES: cytochrome d ubiquinol oxidase subunit II [unclassified Jannaschia]GIT91212.1 cytochrome bd ubiquinol oxidase subunit II [Jannaschia sp. AI_61]GIT95044.1 cytochrome bd ubiquinol oxidase subunit II [Jannaschia sp. AI_62]